MPVRFVFEHALLQVILLKLAKMGLPQTTQGISLRQDFP
jgi:hypothetical protein